MRLIFSTIILIMATSTPAFTGPMNNAAKKGDAVEIKRLLSSGGDANEVDPMASPLHWAAMNGHTEVVQVLVARGANLDAPSSILGMPLHVATKFDREGSALALLRAGADPNVRDRNELTPLHFAALAGNKRITEALLEAGADAKAVTYGSGRSSDFEIGWFQPLHLSERHDHSEVSELLRKAGGGSKNIEPMADLIATGDPKRGKELAVARCTRCHILDAASPTGGSSYFSGPPINNIYGQPVAATKGFDYSAALSNFGGVWSDDRLFAVIQNPMLTVPGIGKPEIKGLTADDIADVVAFLKSTSD